MSVKKIVNTLVSVGRKIAQGIEKAASNRNDENLLMALFSALAVRDGISKKDAFSTVKLAIAGDTEVSEKSPLEKKIKYAHRRIGMGFRILKGGSGGKVAHPRHEEILHQWLTGEEKKGFALEMLYDDVRTTRNPTTPESRLASLLEKVGFRDSLEIFNRTFKAELKDIREQQEAEKMQDLREMEQLEVAGV